jgi:hypothetical protein
VGIRQRIVEKGEIVKESLKQRLEFAEKTLQDESVLKDVVNQREDEIRTYYEEERHIITDDEKEAREKPINKYFKAKEGIQKLTQDDKDFILAELSELKEQTDILASTNNSIRTLLGVFYWSTNMAVSNAAEFGSTAYLLTKALEIDDPELKSIALGAMSIYIAYSNQWFVPTVAGVTRVLIHTVPEEIINRAISKYILKDAYPPLDLKKHFLDKKNAILTLEGTGVLVLPILNLLRAMKLKASYKTIEYLINLEVLKNSLESN